MARKNTTTPAASADDVVARGADVPLALAAATGARDALLDPREGDYIPDNEEKGYHVGTERQPAEAVLTRGGDVRFESIASEPSKFVDGQGESIIDKLKAAHNAVDGAADENIAPVVTTTREEALGLPADGDES